MKAGKLEKPKCMLAGPQPCTIVCFALAVTLRKENVSIGQLLGHNSKRMCFVHGQGQKREQKHGTKNFVGLHNHYQKLIDKLKHYQKLTKRET